MSRLQQPAPWGRTRAWVGVWLCALVAHGCGGNTRLEEVEVGFQGPARHNPFLAAEFLARELGYEAQSVRRLPEMPPTDWVLLVHQQALGSLTQVEGLFEWVSEGGRLWISGVPALPWSPSSPSGIDAEDFEERKVGARLQMILDWIQGDLATWQDVESLAPMRLESLPEVPFEWPGPYSIGTPELKGLEVAGTSESASIMRMQYHGGQVELFAGLHGFDSHHLRDDARARVFAHLLAHPEPAGGLMILYGRQAGFFAMLWARAWPLIVLFAAWILFWLWRHLRRFGPIEQDPHWDPDGEGVGRRREFTEHLEAAARHYQRVQASEWITRSAASLRAVEGARDARLAPAALQDLGLQERMQRLQRKAFGPSTREPEPSPANRNPVQPQTIPNPTSSPDHAES